MKTATFTRSLGLGVTAVLVATAFPFTAASAAAPGYTLDAVSKDGSLFSPGDYAAGDITVQVRDALGATYDVVDSQDLEYSWTFTPFNGSPTTLPADVQPTDVGGQFVVALPVVEGPGTYVLAANLEQDPNGVSASTASLTLTVAEAAPAGSVATVERLTSGTPGTVEEGVAKLKDANGNKLVDRLVTLNVDHGFFTNGKSATGDAAGDVVGNLVQDGTTLTTTTDGDGFVDFKVGIARDGGFDDDGLVDAAVTVTGVPTSGTKASWNSADPLNGDVAIRLSPGGVQENAVNPTPVLKRTFYDVFALDQFGNPVASNDGDDITVDLDFTNTRDGFDYDDNAPLANLTSYGDFYVYAELPGTVGIKGTWQEAPSTVYNGSGNAVPVLNGKDVSTSTGSTYYAPSFSASSFSMTSSVSDTVRIGTTVTQTVRVRDQLGNPVDGYEVRFLRYGPDEVRGEVVATRTTNALGEATYTFIGTKAGRSSITAEVTDGLRRTQLTGQVSFGKVVRAKLVKTKGSSSGRGSDRMTVTTRAAAPGARVYLYKIVKGTQRLVGSHKLNRKGQAAFSIRDRNRGSRTTYVAQVRSTTTTIADRSNIAKLR